MEPSRSVQQLCLLTRALGHVREIESQSGRHWSVLHAERWLLYALTRVVAPRIAVELGRWQGASTLWIGAGLAQNGRGILHSIDAIDSAEARRALQVAGLTSVVEVHVGDSHGSCGRQTAREIGYADMIFVDAGHVYQDVSADTTLWSTLLSSNGILVFHDAANPHTPGVTKVVDDLLATGRWRGLVLARDEETGVGYPAATGLALLQKCSGDCSAREGK
jgi:predicted O-methyltransferase YrrM